MDIARWAPLAVAVMLCACSTTGTFTNALGVTQAVASRDGSVGEAVAPQWYFLPELVGKTYLWSMGDDTYKIFLAYVQEEPGRIAVHMGNMEGPGDPAYFYWDERRGQLRYWRGGSYETDSAVSLKGRTICYKQGRHGQECLSRGISPAGRAFVRTSETAARMFYEIPNDQLPAELAASRRASVEAASKKSRERQEFWTGVAQGAVDVASVVTEASTQRPTTGGTTSAPSPSAAGSRTAPAAAGANEPFAGGTAATSPPLTGSTGRAASPDKRVSWFFYCDALAAHKDYKKKHKIYISEVATASGTDYGFPYEDQVKPKMEQYLSDRIAAGNFQDTGTPTVECSNGTKNREEAIRQRAQTIDTQRRNGSTVYEVNF